MKTKTVPVGKEAVENKDANVVREAKKNRGRVEGLNGTDSWQYMQKKFGLTGEQLVHMKQAMIGAKVEGTPAILVRIFDHAVTREKGVTIEDYESLNEHPELILYEGYYSGHGQASVISIERRNDGGTSLLEKMIKEGTITEVGVKEKETASRKWLGRFGRFLMMGGFILVMVVIAGIIMVVSMCNAPK